MTGLEQSIVWLKELGARLDDDGRLTVKNAIETLQVMESSNDTARGMYRAEKHTSSRLREALDRAESAIERIGGDLEATHARLISVIFERDELNERLKAAMDRNAELRRSTKEGA
jgi:hypothetical protein